MGASGDIGKNIRSFKVYVICKDNLAKIKVINGGNND